MYIHKGSNNNNHSIHVRKQMLSSAILLRNKNVDNLNITVKLICQFS